MTSGKRLEEPFERASRSSAFERRQLAHDNSSTSRQETMSLNVLFIGGTGNISLSCVAEAVKAGHRVSVFNRAKTAVDLPRGVTAIAGDLKDAAAYRQLGKAGFDAVCQFIAFTPEQMAVDVA